MITILIKDEKGKMYSTSSFNEKLIKEVDNKLQDNSLLMKHLAKEFEVNSESIHKFWTVK